MLAAHAEARRPQAVAYSIILGSQPRRLPLRCGGGMAGGNSLLLLGCLTACL